MALEGCAPLPLPDPIYDPVHVEQWAEEMKASCDAFREEILAVDCSATPCVLKVQAEPASPGFPTQIDWVDTEPFLDELTCGRTDGPTLHLHARAHYDVAVDLVVAWPELNLEDEVWHRVRIRGDNYDKGELQALLEGAD